MERRKFLKQCGVIGASCLGFSVIMNSCTGTHHVVGLVENNKVKLSKSEFLLDKKNGKTAFRKYIILRTENSIFPIVIYRYSESEYKALLLRCTHQFYELNVNGDLISCTAHGSEFSNRGKVIRGPAEEPLKEFKIDVEEKTIYLNIA